MIEGLQNENRNLKAENQKLKNSVALHVDQIDILQKLPYLEQIEKDTILKYQNAKLFDFFKNHLQVKWEATIQKKVHHFFDTCSLEKHDFSVNTNDTLYGCVICKK